MTPFVHDTLPQRVVVDSGGSAHRVREEVERLGAQRVMLIASGRASALADRVAAEVTIALRWDEVAQHVPLEVAERARAAAADHGIDLVVSVGGGSTTGLAKAVAMTTKLPIVAVPTTYAGSEATAMWGLTADATKKTGIDVAVLPKVVVYDAELTLSLPVDLSVASGLNGLAHCIDSMWAPGTDPIVQAFALEGMRTLATGLPRVVADPADLDGRETSLLGAYLSAVSFASAGSGLHHKICHVLGGTFDLPHAQTHAIVLPHVLALNAPAVPDVAGRIAAALGEPAAGDEPATAATHALDALYARLEAPRALADVGFTEAGIADAVERILAVAPDSNPAPVTRENLTELLQRALTGAPPTTIETATERRRHDHA